MGWQDRPYSRDRSDSGMGPLLWLLSGSVPLFTAFGIRVRAHASLVVYATVLLLLGLGNGFAWQDRLESLGALFCIVLLHEFGHCFAARWVGGYADDILMHPLGGFAMAHPPRRPLPTFITVAAGPAVNLLICIGAGALLWSINGWLPGNPFRPTPIGRYFNWFDVTRYVYWIYFVSYELLIFNLLPIFPLDGGQMLQAILWPWMGYFRSMLLSCVVGMVASALGFAVALATLNIFLAVMAAMLFLYCLQTRRQLLAMGPEEDGDEVDYSAAYEPATPKRRPPSRAARRAVARARQVAQDVRLEQERLDAILAKVSATGLASLTRGERATLRKATEQRRKRDMELSG